MWIAGKFCTRKGQRLSLTPSKQCLLGYPKRKGVTREKQASGSLDGCVRHCRPGFPNKYRPWFRFRDASEQRTAWKFDEPDSLPHRVLFLNLNSNVGLVLWPWDARIAMLQP